MTLPDIARQAAEAIYPTEEMSSATAQCDYDEIVAEHRERAVPIILTALQQAVAEREKEVALLQWAVDNHAQAQPSEGPAIGTTGDTTDADWQVAQSLKALGGTPSTLATEAAREIADEALRKWGVVGPDCEAFIAAIITRTVVEPMEAQRAKELDDVLKPFVALLQEHNEFDSRKNPYPDSRPIFAINGAEITLGDLRKARTALSARTAKQEERT